MSDNLFQAPYTRLQHKLVDMAEQPYLHWLHVEFRKLNEKWFDGKLVEPRFGNLHEVGTMGMYNYETNTLLLDYRLIDLMPDMACDSLLHEMTHEYVAPIEWKIMHGDDFDAREEIDATGGHTERWATEARKRGVRGIPHTALRDAVEYGKQLATHGRFAGPVEHAYYQAMIEAKPWELAQASRNRRDHENVDA